MGYCVFLHRPDSRYDDEPEIRYQFPKQYLGRASQAERDWIVYYEPGGGRGYFAIARVDRIVPDPTQPDMYLALIEPGSYLPFERNVPFRTANGVVERGVLNERGGISGRAQAAVRSLSTADLDRILDLGFADDTPLLPRVDAVWEPSRLREEPAPFIFETPRARVEHVTSRPVRDRVFRKLVLDAYDARCAITGHGFINGGGRAEVEAAHIRPVEHDGPDVVGNGLALSGTAHWMFDRGLISLADDLAILISRHINDKDAAGNLLNPSRRAIVPGDPALRPHPRFLAWHRDHCFKG
jgi:putative restriction endonuclease